VGSRQAGREGQGGKGQLDCRKQGGAATLPRDPPWGGKSGSGLFPTDVWRGIRPGYQGASVLLLSLVEACRVKALIRTLSESHPTMSVGHVGTYQVFKEGQMAA
jgi:hypothetical protein